MTLALGCAGGPRSAPLGEEQMASLPAAVLRWQQDTGRGIETAPIRLGDSLLVATTDRRLVLIDLVSGARLWRKRVGGTLVGDPQLSRSELVVTTALPDGSVYLYNLNRKKPLWRHVLGDPAGGARLFENIVLAPTRDGKVNGLSALDGRVVWVTNLETRLSGDPTFIFDRALLIVPGRDGKLAAVDARSGEKRWVTDLKEPLIGVASDSGLVVAAGLSGTFYGLSALNGRGLWKAETSAPLGPAPILAEGIVLAATLDGQLLAWRRDGRPVWHRRLGGPFRAAPAVRNGRGLVVAVSGLGWYFSLADGVLLGSVLHPETVLATPTSGARNEWVIPGERGIIGSYEWSVQ